MTASRLIAFLTLATLPSPHYAQWSTSTRAESTLYVCPGFYPGIVTFDDGSSIVLGALQSYIFARKLDERGNYLWSPLQIFHNDSSFITEVRNPFRGEWGAWVSDGDGGVILFWYDHRGAYDTGTEFANNSIYLQRVDRIGNLRWTSGGVRVKGPASGWKFGDMVSDGRGGVILAWIERGFGYPGAPNREYLQAAKYDQEGRKAWDVTIDSSLTAYTLQDAILYRGGARLYINYSGNGSYSRIIDTSGNILSTVRTFGFSVATEKESVAYVLSVSVEASVTKLGNRGDTLWASRFFLPPGCNGARPFRNTSLVPDAQGGVYFLYACGDTIFHFASDGQNQRVVLDSIGRIGGWVFNDAVSGVVIANSDNGRAQRYFSTGQGRWNPTFRYLSNPNDSYFAVLNADKKGGIIAAHWTTLGGIFAQHTGRDGGVGIITKVEEIFVHPLDFHVEQNYPNPFNSSTNISYSVSKQANISIEIFDLLGREVMNLVNQRQSVGKYIVQLDVATWSSGVYVYAMRVDGLFVAAKKMLLLR
jgi:hypothetical protein